MSRFFLVLVAVFAAVAQRTQAQMPGSGRRQRDKEPVPVKADLKHIKCDVCSLAMEHAFEDAEAKRAEAIPMTVNVRPGVKETRSSFSEEDVNEVLNGICHRRKKNGEWIWRTDLVEVSSESKPKGKTFYKGLTKAERKSGKNYLLVALEDGPGKWDHESASVARACQTTLDDMDMEELAVAMWKGPEHADDGGVGSAKELVKLGCKELSNACKGKAGRVPLADERAHGGAKERLDAVFAPQEQQLIETEQMMQNMEEAGSPMVMQSREDMEEEMREMAEEMGMTPEEMDALMASGGGGGEEPISPTEGDTPNFVGGAGGEL